MIILKRTDYGCRNNPRQIPFTSCGNCKGCFRNIQNKVQVMKELREYQLLNKICYNIHIPTN